MVKRKSKSSSPQHSHYIAIVAVVAVVAVAILVMNSMKTSTPVEDIAMEDVSEDALAGKGFFPGSPSTCSDSDNGVNEYVFGETSGILLYSDVDKNGINTLKGAYAEVKDKCLNSNILREYSCSQNKVIRKNINCPGGCEVANGLCASAPASPCSDSDNGVNEYVFGETSGTLLYSDVDKNGIYKAKGAYAKVKDKCLNSNLLREYSCSQNKVIRKNINCPGGCENGLCVLGKKDQQDAGEAETSDVEVSGVLDPIDISTTIGEEINCPVIHVSSPNWGFSGAELLFKNQYDDNGRLWLQGMGFSSYAYLVECNNDIDMIFCHYKKDERHLYKRISSDCKNAEKTADEKGCICEN